MPLFEIPGKVGKFEDDWRVAMVPLGAIHKGRPHRGERGGGSGRMRTKADKGEGDSMKADIRIYTCSHLI